MLELCDARIPQRFSANYILPELIGSNQTHDAGQVLHSPAPMFASNGARFIAPAAGFYLFSDCTDRRRNFKYPNIVREMRQKSSIDTGARRMGGRALPR